MKNFKRYSEYKSSGNGLIGDIPEEWIISRLGFLANVIDPQPDHRAPKAVIGGYPYFGIRDVNLDGSLNVITARKISLEAIEKQENSYTIENGDIIFCKVGTLGHPKQVLLPRTRFALSATLVIIKVHDKSIQKFIKFVLESYYIKNIINSVVTGSTRPALGIQQIRKFPIAINSNFKEVNFIANYLDQKTTAIDQLIQKKEQLIQLLEEERTAMINQAVTKGLDPTVPMKDSGIEWLGEVPAHWEVKKLDYLANVIDPQPDHRAPKVVPNGYPYIGIRDVNNDGSVNVITARKVSEKAVAKQESSYSIVNGDIIFGKVGTLGHPKHIIKPATRFALSATLVVIQSLDNENKKFLRYALDSFYIKNCINTMITGSTRPALGIQQIRKFPIAISNDINEVIIIVDFLNAKTQEINQAVIKTKQQIKLLKEYKTTLISDVVTGEIDIRTAVLE